MAERAAAGTAVSPPPPPLWVPTAAVGWCEWNAAAMSRLPPLPSLPSVSTLSDIDRRCTVDRLGGWEGTASRVDLSRFTVDRGSFLTATLCSAAMK